jgi:type I site-specific restriction endonuclease
MDLSALTESGICDQFITPAIKAAGLDPAAQIRREVTYTASRIWVQGRMASLGKKRKRAHYVLSYRASIPLGDTHGKAPLQAKPAPHHAELVVNRAGTMAAFLIATLETRQASI